MAMTMSETKPINGETPWIFRIVVGIVIPILALAIAYHDIRFRWSFMRFGRGSLQPGGGAWALIGWPAVANGVALIAGAASLHAFFLAKRTGSWQKGFRWAGRVCLILFLIIEITAQIGGFFYRVDYTR